MEGAAGGAAFAIAAAAAVEGRLSGFSMIVFISTVAGAGAAGVGAADVSGPIDGLKGLGAGAAPREPAAPGPRTRFDAFKIGARCDAPMKAAALSPRGMGEPAARACTPRPDLARSGLSKAKAGVCEEGVAALADDTARPGVAGTGADAELVAGTGGAPTLPLF